MKSSLFKRWWLCVGFLTGVFSALASGPALATVNPFLPPGCPPTSQKGLFEATVQPIQIKIGTRVHLFTNGPIANGALLGVVDLENPAQSQLVAAFPYSGSVGWIWAVSVGFWVANAANQTASLAVLRAQDTRNPSLPYGETHHRNGNDNPAYTFQGHLLFYGSDIGITKKTPPVGTQIMATAAKMLIAQSIVREEPFDLGAMIGYDPYDYQKWGVDAKICKAWVNAGHHLHLLHVQPIRSVFEIAPTTGSVDVTSSNLIHRVPEGCVNHGSWMACPARSVGGQIPSGFTLKLDQVDASKAWLLLDGQKTNSVNIGQIDRMSVAVSAEYLSELLGTQESASLDALTIKVVPDDMPLLASPLNLLSNVQLTRLTYSVAIEEREPSALGRYSGTIGRDTDITIPLTIRQFGASRATKVDVQVVADSVATPKGSLCKFAGDRGATVVGIPANVRFHSGAELIDRPDNCSGVFHDITTMAWREALGGKHPYAASLDMDLVFPLSPKDLRLDLSGSAWQGRLEASGEVRVRAEWR